MALPHEQGARAYITSGELVETFDQVQVGQGSVESIDERLAVRGDQDRADGGDAGWVSRYQLLPERSFSRGQIEAVDFGGNFSGLVDEKSFARPGSNW